MHCAVSMNAAHAPRPGRPDQLPTTPQPGRLQSATVQRTVGAPPRNDSAFMRALALDPHELSEAARHLADRLEEDALKYAKQLSILDLTRSRACQDVATSARDAAVRFRGWKWDPPPAQRQGDFAFWSVVVRKARALGVDVSGDVPS